MQPIAATSPASVPTATPPATPPAAGTPAAPAGGAGQSAVANAIRNLGAGYEAAAGAASTQADRATIYPVESIYTGVSMLADKTRNVPVLGKITGIVKTVAGFGLLIEASNISSMLNAPGATAADLANGVADMIDGQQTRDGWSIGFGLDSGEAAEQAPQSSVGALLSGLGVGAAPKQ